MEYKKVGVETLGDLIDKLVKESYDITKFKANERRGNHSSEDAKKSINETYISREMRADLLVRVIVWDIQKNQGKSGKYFNFFKHKMKKFGMKSKKMIQDVTKKIKDGLKHGASHQNSKNEKVNYEKRLGELSKY
jgi:hypothetical protein